MHPIAMKARTETEASMAGACKSNLPPHVPRPDLLCWDGELMSNMANCLFASCLNEAGSKLQRSKLVIHLCTTISKEEHLAAINN